MKIRFVLLVMALFACAKTFAMNDYGGSGIRFSFKHTARSGSACVGGDGCSCPLGICISRGMDDYPTERMPAPGTITDDGYGYGFMSVVQTQRVYLDPSNTTYKNVGTVRIVFNQSTTPAEGFISIIGNAQISNDISSKLGFGRIVILDGDYTVRPSTDGAFGEIIINCEFFN